VRFVRRASPAEHKAALERQQLDGLRAYATAKGYQIVHVVSEVASGMNDDRPKLHALLKLRTLTSCWSSRKKAAEDRFGFRWV